MSAEPIKVLLVEDSLGDAHLLYENLTDAFPAAFTITHVRRLSEALEWLWEEHCDVVLLDLGLPDSHGLDTLQLTRAQAPELPIVVLTGFNDSGIGVEAVKAGAQDYLVKGEVSSTLLARSMRYAIARKEAEDALLRRATALVEAGELKRSRQRIITVQETLRRDIATALDSNVLVKLAALKGYLGGLPAGAISPVEMAQYFGPLMQELQKEVSTLRRRLYPPLLSQGLFPALQALSEQSGIETIVELPTDQRSLPGKAEQAKAPDLVALAAYRITEAALNNAVSQARAKKVTIRLELVPNGQLLLTVADDGQRFDPDVGTGQVTVDTMRDYAESVGGACMVQDAPGFTTSIVAMLPLLGAQE